jgi:hypothetical protein
MALITGYTQVFLKNWILTRILDHIYEALYFQHLALFIY